MTVGITYDLRDDYLALGYDEEETAEFDRPATVEAIAGALTEIGHRPDRIGNGRQLVERLARGDTWDLVFNIAEGLHGVGREAQVPAILDLFGIPYTFSDPLVLSLTLNKAMTSQVVRSFGIHTADFAVVATPAGIETVNIPFPLFVKPVREGTGKGISPRSIVRTPEELATQCREILSRFRQPALVEQFLPGREFTVGLVGTADAARVVGVLEILLGPSAEGSVYSYRNKEECEERVTYRIATDRDAEAAAELALRAWRGLGCRDAGRVDVRLDGAGVATFMEVNPLAGLHPEHSDLPIICTGVGMSYRELIGEIIASATARPASAADASESLRIPDNRGRGRPAETRYS